METKSVTPDGAAAGGQPGRPFLLLLVLLLVILGFIFRGSFLGNNVVFSNDGPLGAMLADQNRLPATWTGLWVDLSWLGSEWVTPAPDVSFIYLFLTGPVLYCRTFAAFSLLFAAVGAYFCFRQTRLAPVACILGALAAALNSDFFSTSCWGVAAQMVAAGMMFVAVGLIANPALKRTWVRAVLAGLAVGTGVMEGYDIGALFSLAVAGFVLFQAMFVSREPGTMERKFWRGILRTALVAGCAGFIAANTINNLVGTQITSAAGGANDEASRTALWEARTQWSVPKKEALQVIVPGVFGFRDNWYMYEDDSPKEDQYWGSIGAVPGMLHLIGTGFYAGVPVVMLALWALFQSFRRGASVFATAQRRAIWFWGIVLLVSLLLSFGKFAPFYKLFYALPGASTIRNPAKFMHIFSWAIVILFAYGVDGLVRTYFGGTAAEGSFGRRLKNCFQSARAADRNWLLACAVALVLSAAARWVYGGRMPALRAYLQTVGISPLDAAGVADFSLRAVEWYVAFLLVTIILLWLVFSGQFTGARAKWGAIGLGALLVLDLGRADVPWLVYWNVPYKYHVDPVIQFLADKPYEHRVALLPIPVQTWQWTNLFNTYAGDWKQHLFPSRNIQCSEDIQDPRVSADKAQFTAIQSANLPRFWQLSNTRYLLGPADFARQADPSGTQFRNLKTFNFVPKRQNPSPWPEDYRAEPMTNGELAVIEFTRALPRAKLFSSWEFNTNGLATLQTLANPAFDPMAHLIVADPVPAADAANREKNPGTVEITSYLPKRIELRADVKVPSVLLLSERYNPKWQVEVDGRPAPLLRCDFILRGVYLPPGKHEIVTRFVTPSGTLVVSLMAIAIGLALCGYLVFFPAREDETAVGRPISSGVFTGENGACRDKRNHAPFCWRVTF